MKFSIHGLPASPIVGALGAPHLPLIPSWQTHYHVFCLYSQGDSKDFKC